MDTINQYRATLGLPPYQRWASAESCACGEAKTDSETPDGSGGFGVPHAAFPQCNEGAQNECPGWSGTPDSIIPGCLAMMWKEGPGPFAGHGHYLNMSSTQYLNMSSTQYTKVSCGFYVTPAGKVWAVQDFK